MTNNEIILDMYSKNNSLKEISEKVNFPIEYVKYYIDRYHKISKDATIRSINEMYNNGHSVEEIAEKFSLKVVDVEMMLENEGILTW